jgi:formylglycine-generating enzyme required for sulfatase activity
LLRVLRGGAYWCGPWDLRSTDRVRVVPEIWSVVVGFRCVRGLRRQP